MLPLLRRERGSSGWQAAEVGCQDSVGHDAYLAGPAGVWMRGARDSVGCGRHWDSSCGVVVRPVRSTWLNLWCEQVLRMAGDPLLGLDLLERGQVHDEGVGLT
jgi:hypothetical protein